ncbi:MAG: hypothetical protein U0531_17435 [Dehalococcoidia bacterium]
MTARASSPRAATAAERRDAGRLMRLVEALNKETTPAAVRTALGRQGRDGLQINKIVATFDEAVADIVDGSSIHSVGSAARTIVRPT